MLSFWCEQIFWHSNYNIIQQTRCPQIVAYHLMLIENTPSYHKQCMHGHHEYLSIPQWGLLSRLQENVKLKSSFWWAKNNAHRATKVGFACFKGWTPNCVLIMLFFIEFGFLGLCTMVGMDILWNRRSTEIYINTFTILNSFTQIMTKSNNIQD